MKIRVLSSMITSVLLLANTADAARSNVYVQNNLTQALTAKPDATGWNEYQYFAVTEDMLWNSGLLGALKAGIYSDRSVWFLSGVKAPVLTIERMGGVKNGVTYYITSTMKIWGDAQMTESKATTLVAKFKLTGTTFGSNIWHGVDIVGPNVNIISSYKDDRQEYKIDFNHAGKLYTVKYQGYFTGGYDDYTYTLSGGTQPAGMMAASEEQIVEPTSATHGPQPTRQEQPEQPSEKEQAEREKEAESILEPAVEPEMEITVPQEQPEAIEIIEEAELVTPEADVEELLVEEA